MDFSIDFLGAGRGGDIFVLPSGKLEKEGTLIGMSPEQRKRDQACAEREVAL